MFDFQGCGGGWGGPADAIFQAREHTQPADVVHTAESLATAAHAVLTSSSCAAQMEDEKNKCGQAEGPFPQGTGTRTGLDTFLIRDTAPSERLSPCGRHAHVPVARACEGARTR
jgi:hypothetical protein